ncbi:hypothetical protein M422DRAFT_251534 [Sphaerobolus stellatus SS14]|uniref:Unplaced genomic scaffold SPHSTscaffold_39, whole genome shotgun sequence n=1 Tax=Sphaerobolus stellatus (strain SS14) TaxID=990650 RepID=A0A0C9W0J0_SPHS4|nr:hypothetical protein M422DRAFT_251534 [Sphaerobolus stellatus SS14]
MAWKLPPLPTFKEGEQGSLDDDEEEKLEKLEKQWDDYQTMKNHKTVKGVWDPLCRKFEEEEPIVKVDVRKQMYVLKCEDKLEVESHIEKLMSLKEWLSSTNDKLDDSKYITIIPGSLLNSYHSIGQSLSAAAWKNGKPLTAQMVIDAVLHEYHCQDNEKKQELALAAKGYCGNSCHKNGGGLSSNSGGKGGNNSKSSGLECWKCGKIGHVKAECHLKKKKKRVKTRIQK